MKGHGFPRAKHKQERSWAVGHRPAGPQGHTHLNIKLQVGGNREQRRTGHSPSVGLSAQIWASGGREWMAGERPRRPQQHEDPQHGSTTRQLQRPPLRSREDLVHTPSPELGLGNMRPQELEGQGSGQPRQGGYTPVTAACASDSTCRQGTDQDPEPPPLGAQPQASVALGAPGSVWAPGAAPCLLAMLLARPPLLCPQPCSRLAWGAALPGILTGNAVAYLQAIRLCQAVARPEKQEPLVYKATFKARHGGASG